MAKTVFRSDSLTYTHDGAKIRSILIPSEMENGSPVVMGALVTSGEFAGAENGGAELFSVTLPSAATDKIWIVTTPEVDYVNSPITEFTNKEGSIGRAILFEKADIFSLSKADGSSLLSAEPTLTNCYLTPKAGGGWTVSSTATNAVAKFIGTDLQDGITMYGFEVL